MPFRAGARQLRSPGRRIFRSVLFGFAGVRMLIRGFEQRSFLILLLLSLAALVYGGALLTRQHG
ncbi:MAG: hypothetical protein QOH97_4233 [Actinoplanes sp.]|nr:hypothetical protein [Actinoplanes sp.]